MITKSKPLTVKEVAEQTGICAHTIRRLCDQGRIKAANVSTSSKRRVWVVTAENLEAFLSGSTSHAAIETQEPKQARVRRRRIDENVPKHF